MLGESPANCAFHLRTLAKYGFVEEAGGGRGRERPWRRAYDTLSWGRNPGDPGAALAAEALDQVWMDRLLTRARRSLTSAASWPQDLGDALGASSSRLYVTSAEARRLYAEIWRPSAGCRTTRRSLIAGTRNAAPRTPSRSSSSCSGTRSSTRRCPRPPVPASVPAPKPATRTPRASASMAPRPGRPRAPARGRPEVQTPAAQWRSRVTGEARQVSPYRCPLGHPWPSAAHAAASPSRSYRPNSRYILTTSLLEIHRMHVTLVPARTEPGDAMHPEIAKTLVAQHRDELVRSQAARPRAGRPVPAVAYQLDQDRAGPGPRPVRRDHHLGPPVGLTRRER